MRQRVALVYTVFLGTPQNKHMVALKLPCLWYNKRSNMKQDKHIQLNLSEDVEKIMCDYDLILRVNDRGTKFIAFDIFDYANQKYIFTHKLKHKE